MTDASKSQKWLTSREARTVLKVSTCELMHLRVAGKVRHRKQGNAFLYDGRGVTTEAKRRRV